MTFLWHSGNVSPPPSRASQAVSCAAEKFWKTSPKLTFLAASRVFLLISGYLRDYRRRMVHYMRRSSTRKLSLFGELRQEKKKKNPTIIYILPLPVRRHWYRRWKWMRQSVEMRKKITMSEGESTLKMQSLKASKRVLSYVAELHPFDQDTVM